MQSIYLMWPPHSTLNGGEDIHSTLNGGKNSVLSAKRLPTQSTWATQPHAATFLDWCWAHMQPSTQHPCSHFTVNGGVF